MKAAIYNQYLDTLGGGELYTLSFGRALSELGYKVDIEWSDPKILKKLSERFDLDTSGMSVVADIKRGDGYDICFWVSDGSIPTLKSRNNILHFQVPFVNVGGTSLLNKMKLFRINKVICNSEFTKRFIDREFGVKSVVVYPPVDTGLRTESNTKENLVLYVGRFSQLLQSKNQDVLIDAFKKLIKNKVGKWKLVLAGGVEVGVGNYLLELKKKATGYPIEIIESPTRQKLRSLYKKAKIYWSASGFGSDESKYPQKVEHFGITVVEAMTFGVVPFCYKAGGHKEIIRDNKNGFLWSKTSDLVDMTVKVIKKPDELKQISSAAKSDALRFGYENFFSEIKGLL